MQSIKAVIYFAKQLFNNSVKAVSVSIKTHVPTNKLFRKIPRITDTNAGVEGSTLQRF